MDIPKLLPNAVSVIRADYEYGKILNNDNTFYQSVGDNYFKIYNSIKEAKAGIELDRKESSIKCEYMIHDYLGKFIEMIK